MPGDFQILLRGKLDRRHLHCDISSHYTMLLFLFFPYVCLFLKEATCPFFICFIIIYTSLLSKIKGRVLKLSFAIIKKFSVVDAVMCGPDSLPKLSYFLSSRWNGLSKVFQLSPSSGLILSQTHHNTPITETVLIS